MKLYKTTYIDDQAEKDGLNPIRAVWHGTQAQAAAARKMMHSDGMREIETEGVEVPTDKAGLIAYLNSMEQTR